MNDRKLRRRRRSGNGFVDILNGLLTLLVIGLLVAGGVVLYGASQFYGDGPLTQETTFRVEALRAVANPDSHDYLYFVAKGATPREGHVFAETYAEHRENVAQYRRIVDEAAAQAEEARRALEAQEAEGADEAAAE
jgi:hypothetical protein